MKVIDPYRFGGDDRLFDLISGGVGGYSLKKLRKNYTGYACNIRRSSDSATTDVDFDINDIVSATSNVSAGGDLATWAGVSTLYVTRIYDQSTGVWNVDSPGTPQQPILNGSYEIDYTTVQYLDEGETVDAPPFNFTRTDPFSIATRITTSGNGVIFARNDLSGNFPGWNIRIVSNFFRFQFFSNVTIVIDVRGGSIVNDGTEKILVMTYDGSSSASGVTLYVNGVSESITTITDNLIMNPNYLNTTFKTNGRGPVGSIALGLAKTNSDILIFNKELSPAEVTLINTLI